MIPGASPGRHPRVHWEDRPGYLESPPPGGGFLPGGGGSPPYGYIDDFPRRFAGESPQRYLEAPPLGYQDSPARRFPSRPPPPPQYLSPEDSPPYRYIEDAPRRFSGGPRPYLPEDLPYDIDGPPPPGFVGEGPRRFAGTPPGRYADYRNEPVRRFAGSESPSPPRRYGPPPPPPAAYLDGRFAAAPPRQFRGGSPPGYADEPPRRFAGTPPRQFRSGSPPGYADEPPGWFAGNPRQFPDGSPPGYQDEAPRRFIGTPPRQFYDGSPPRYANEAPRKFATTPPRLFPDGSPPGYAEDAPPRRFAGTPPRRPDGPPPLSPPRLLPGAYAGSRTPPRLPPGGAAPPQPPPDVHPRSGTPPRFSPEVFPVPGRPAPTPGSDASKARTPGDSPSDFALGGAPPSYPGRYEAAPHPPYATPPREPYRPPPPGLGTDSPLLGVPPGYATPPRIPPPGRGSSPPEFIFAGLPRRHPDGYTARTPPRQPPPRPPGLGNDAIFTADVVPIELDDKLKEIGPHQGNPGSSTGGGWKDLWAALLFLLHIGGIAALCVIFGLQGLTSTIRNYNTPNSFHINDWFPQLAAAAIVGAIFSCLWQNAIRMAPVLMILVTVWTGAAAMILFGIVLIATGKTTGLIGLVFLFAGICQALYAFVVRDRIPFAGDMLKKVLSVCNTYPSTYAVSYIFVLVALGWLALWIFGLSGSVIRPKHVAIIVGLVASLIWTMQVFRNIVRVTVANTVALFYFQEHNMPHMPTYVSLIRACSSSLGSICIGSLFVPIVEVPCHALRRINAQAGASEFMFSCVICFLGCFEHLIRYFNKMGYIQVAIYGKPFVRASKDTWDMLKAQSVDVLVHDDLTSTILLLACGIGGSVSALIGGIWTFIAVKNLSVVISLLSYLIGFLITYLTMAVVESGVATYYVCFAEDPASLQRHDGPLYEKMWVRQMDLQSPVTELTI